MNFATFIDFLNCLYINEVEDATRTNNQERIATMVFEGSFEGDASADPMVAESNRRQAQRYFNMDWSSHSIFPSPFHFY